MLNDRTRSSGQKLAAAAIIGLGLSAAAAPENAGEELFAAQCGDCHGDRDIAFWARQYPEEEERRAWLDGFLERHYPPTEDERALIIDYIEEIIAAN